MEMASPVVETSEVSQSSIVDSALHLNEGMDFMSCNVYLKYVCLCIKLCHVPASLRKQLDNAGIFRVDKLKQRPNALLLPASPRMQLDDAAVVRVDNSKQRQHFCLLIFILIVTLIQN